MRKQAYQIPTPLGFMMREMLKNRREDFDYG